MSRAFVRGMVHVVFLWSETAHIHQFLRCITALFTGKFNAFQKKLSPVFHEIH